MSTPTRILRKPEVMKFAGMRHTQLNEHIAKGEFPAPIKLTDSGRAVGWLEHELIEWMERRTAARDAKKTGATEAPSKEKRRA